MVFALAGAIRWPGCPSWSNEMASLFWETVARLLSRLKLDSNPEEEPGSFYNNIDRLRNEDGQADQEDATRPWGLPAYSQHLAIIVASLAEGISRGVVRHVILSSRAACV